MNLKDPSGRLARWALRLQEHDFDVKYKTGKMHSDTDALSRNPVEEETETPDKFLAVTTSMNLAMEQKKDQDLAKLKLLSNSSKNEEFRFIDGILCRKNFDPDGKLWLPVIPKHLRADILRHFHDAPTAGHLGFAKTYDRIRKRFYWLGMYRNVVRYVMHCRECQRRKSVPQRPPGRLVPIPPAIAPFHRIGIDLLGRFPKSAHGNKWIIVCTDYSTRYAITKALPTAEVDEIAKFLLEEIVLRHGAPRVIITDRGAVFRSRLVSSLVDLCNIDHRFTTAYHPQTNGLTERFNKTLADMLSMYVDVEQKNWDEILPFVTFAYNTAKQETTGFMPFYLLHGREAETTLDTMLPFCPNDFDDNNITNIAARAEESRQLTQVHTLRAQDKDRRRYDSKHQMVSYAPGDLVWVYTPVRKVGLSEKLLRRYFGPYQVLRRLSAVTYAVQDFDPASRKRKLREVVHVLRMKPYHDPAEQIETEDIPPKESYKGPITRSRIKTLEQNDSGALRNPENCSVLRSELIAIDEGLKAILNRTDSSNTWILTDSRSTIQHLQDWTRVEDLVSIRIINKLKTIAKYRVVHFQWIPSHVSVPGNEVADFLAKRGCSEVETTDFALAHISRDLIFNESQGQASLDSRSRPSRD
ncbi:transposon Tf2-9 polyprotein [Trichonephila clavipes]|uniref:RNA-directed DNA polymerase n=1 Tax=Trichonephila clavipes TaxID=2585209 RepID=A0A8X6VHV2_TRICX|nr:transposon Tf2-9 polyprotein [Trichonephila clavipes]